MTANDTNDEQSNEQTDGQTTVTVANASDPGLLASGHTNGNAVLSPGVYAITEERENPMFSRGEQASEGFTRLAEAGQTETLVKEMENTDGVVTAGAFGDGPITPQSETGITVDASEERYISLAAMLVPSNDTVVATAAPIPLRFRGQRVTGDMSAFLRLYDAGTEPNTAHGQGEDQAPAQSDPLQGDDEGATVRQLSTVSDGVLSPEAGDVASVTFE